jgi:hypothetical protein
MAEGSTVLHSRVPNDVHDRLRAESEHERRTLSQMAAILIEEALDARHPVPPRRDLAYQALDARDAQRREDEDA